MLVGSRVVRADGLHGHVGTVVRRSGRLLRVQWDRCGAVRPFAGIYYETVLMAVSR